MNTERVWMGRELEKCYLLWWTAREHQVVARTGSLVQLQSAGGKCVCVVTCST